MPEGYFGQYVTIAIFTFAGALIVFGTIGLSRLIQPRVYHPEKYTTYESGIDPIGQGWTQANVRYYIFALLFVMFDVEAVFIFPFATRVEAYEWFGMVEMAIFIVILALGLLYAWKKKVLRWV